MGPALPSGRTTGLGLGPTSAGRWYRRLSGGRHDLDGAGVIGDGDGVAGGVAGWDDGDRVVDEVGGVQGAGGGCSGGRDGQVGRGVVVGDGADGLAVRVEDPYRGAVDEVEGAGRGGAGGRGEQYRRLGEPGQLGGAVVGRVDDGQGAIAGAGDVDGARGGGARLGDGHRGRIHRDGDLLWLAGGWDDRDRP